METKRCTKCKEDFPICNFSMRYDYPNRTLSWCRGCERKRKTESARKRLSIQENRRAETLRQKLWVYGLTEQEYRGLIDRAAGRCEICGKESDKLRIDHCHASKNVRGLLCHHCNVGLGHFKDSPGLLNRAAEYLCRSKNLPF